MFTEQLKQLGLSTDAYNRELAKIGKIVYAYLGRRLNRIERGVVAAVECEPDEEPEYTIMTVGEYNDCEERQGIITYHATYVAETLEELNEQIWKEIIDNSEIFL